MAVAQKNKVINARKAALFAVLFSCSIFAENAALQWIKEDWRNKNYPSEFYYTGFSQNTLPHKSDAAKFLKQVERDAQSKLVEGISVRISGVSSIETRTLGGGAQTVASSDFRENFQAQIDAELTKTSVRSYYDKKANKVYAFAAVKKSDLAEFYVSKIESALDETKRGIELSKQLSELDKKKEALRKLDESKSIIDTVAYYRTLLITVDNQNGLKRSQAERSNESLKEIAALRAEIEAADVISVFIIGAQTTEENAADMVISGLQTLLSENNIVVADDEKEAGYILKIDAKVCNPANDGQFYFAYACVKMTLVNTRTGRNEITASVTGQKGGGLSADKAEEKAFKSVAADVWAKVKDKILEN